MNKSSDYLENSVRPAADRFLVLLKTRGPQTAAELGKATGVTGEAVRQQLVRLAADGLVVATAEPRGVGRPAQQYLTLGKHQLDGFGIAEPGRFKPTLHHRRQIFALDYKCFRHRDTPER